MGMRAPSSSTTCDSGAVTVDQMIGSAYATVRFVAQNIEYIKHVSYHMPQVFMVAGDLENIDAVSAVLDEIVAVSDNLSSLVPIADNLTTLEAVANVLPQLMTVHQELAKLLSLFEGLSELLALHTNLTELLGLHSSLAQLLAVDASLQQLLALEAELPKLLQLHGALGDIQNVLNNISSINNVSDNIIEVVHVSDNIAAILSTVDEIVQARGAFGTLDARLDASDTLLNTTKTKADAALPATSYTAADVLAKIKTVDGSGSGLNADQVRGTTPGTTGLSILGAANTTAVKTLLGAGTANGLATLDAGGKVPSTELPSYVDDVLEYASTAAFPTTGESGKIYIAVNAATPADPSRQYRWSGSVYTEISPSPGSTDQVPEGTNNKYYTDARVRAARLTGYTIRTNTAIIATDTVLTALGKLEGQVAARATSAELYDWNI